MGLFAQRLKVPKGDDPVAVLVVELHLPGRAMELVAPCLLEIPPDELVEGDEAVLRVKVDLGEKRPDAVRDVEAIVVIDEVLLLLEELLPVLHAVILLVSVVVEEAVVLALPFLVLQPPLQLGDGRVEGRRTVVLPPASSGFAGSVGRSDSGGVLGVELEAAVGAATVGLEAGGVR
jgi:hypothetical protein